jgi:hypothetical protein
MHGRRLTYPLRCDTQHKQLPLQLFQINSLKSLNKMWRRKGMCCVNKPMDYAVIISVLHHLILNTPAHRIYKARVIRYE